MPPVDRPQGRIVTEPQDAAIQTAIMRQKATDNAVAVCSDGSRLENGCSGYVAVIYAGNGEWIGKAKYLGDNKEAYDAELFGIAAGLALAHRRLHASTPGTVRIFTDSQAALGRLKTDTPGPGQWLLLRITQAHPYQLLVGTCNTTGCAAMPTCQATNRLTRQPKEAAENRLERAPETERPFARPYRSKAHRS